jgi:hypothetical protein
MPRGASKFAAAGLGICLLLLGVVGYVATFRATAPEPVGIDAPPNVFSAARARAELVRLLDDETPHPLGSPANDLVRSRLIARLGELGFDPQVQDALGCSKLWPGCGHVKNVLARIDGETPSALLLMAHYDSVPFAPGAGDDGAGVAALLEIARILKEEGKPHNSIVFAFTDGEEPGLLGAEAFFAQHPWAKDVAAVINLEGSGSSGPVQLLRSTPDSGALVDAFRKVAPHAVASSVAEEVFKRLPNNTDLTVAATAGKAGVDFAFAGERNHYHTPRDSLDNLSDATLQHHGDNALPLARVLARADLTKRKPNYVYATLTPTIWLAYRPQTGLFIAIAIIALLGLATWRRWQGIGHFVGACGIVVTTLLTVVVFEVAALALIDLIAGARSPWPANPWPWRLVIYGIAIVALVLQRPLVRRVGFWNSLLAAWWWWAIATLALAYYLPLATPLLLPATLVATIVIVALAFALPLDRPALRCTGAMVNALIAGNFLLPLAHSGEVIQGFGAAPTIYVPLAVLAVTLLPLLDRGRVKWPRWIAAAATIAGLAWAHWATQYSELLPQHLNFVYVVDADAQRANYVAASDNPLPIDVAGAMPFSEGRAPLPWERDDVRITSADVVQRAQSTIEVRPKNGKTHTLFLRPAAGINSISVVFPKSANVAAIRIAGQTVGLQAPTGDYVIARVNSPPVNGFTLEIDAKAPTIDAYVAEVSHELPPSSAPLTRARGELAVPVHDGDQWVTFRKITL